jgi:hypothetical protein
MLERLFYPYPIQYNVERYMHSTGEWKLMAEIPINFQIEYKSWGRRFVRDRLTTLRQARTAAYDRAVKSSYYRITEIIQYPGTTREFTVWQNNQWVRNLV